MRCYLALKDVTVRTKQGPRTVGKGELLYTRKDRSARLADGTMGDISADVSVESGHLRRWYQSMTEIRQANAAAGQTWFEPDEMRFFSSRIHHEVYGGRYFVTSERASDDVRRFTVREVDDRGHIDTVGEFQQYQSRSGAHAAARKLGDAAAAVAS